MSETNEQIRNLAFELIDIGAEFSPDFIQILGHNRPLGTRWNFKHGSNNFVPFKEFTRSLVTPSQNDTESLTRLIAPHTSTGRILLGIFGGSGEYSMRINSGEWRREGAITFSAKESVARYAAPSSADIGRMMLVDVALTDFIDFPTGRPLTLEDSQLAYRLCVTQVAHQAL